MSGKTQDWEHRYVAPRSKSLESSLQPRPDQDSVEVYPKSSSTQAQLLNQAVIVLVCRSLFGVWGKWHYLVLDMSLVIHCRRNKAPNLGLCFRYRAQSLRGSDARRNAHSSPFRIIQRGACRLEPARKSNAAPTPRSEEVGV